MGSITITEEILNQGRSSKGMWSKKQLLLFGIKSFNVSLKATVLGKEFPTEIVEQFINLKDKHLPSKEENQGELF